MRYRYRKLWKSAIWIGPMIVFGVQAEAAQPDANIMLRAKGFNVISTTLITEREVSTFNLLVSFDGETYREANVGLPRPWRLFYSISYTEHSTTITVPVVGVFSGGVERLLFREPGQKWFRWQIEYKDGTDPRNIVQEIHVGDPTDVDLTFLEHLSDPTLCRLMFRDNWFDQFTETEAKHYAGSEARAVAVIRQLLAVTREKDPVQAIAMHGPRGDIHKAAEMLLSLAKRFPESSYAPYAAHYAGCCYISIASNKLQDAIRRQRTAGQPRGRNPETVELIAFFRSDPDCAKTKEAFTLAAQRADDYLKPRVLFQQAGLSALGGEFDKAEQLMASALELAPRERTIQKWIDKTRKEVDRMRTELEKAKIRPRGVKDSASDAPKP